MSEWRENIRSWGDTIPPDIRANCEKVGLEPEPVWNRYREIAELPDEEVEQANKDLFSLFVVASFKKDPPPWLRKGT